MEQTLASIPGLITGQKKASRTFQAFVKHLGTIKFKYEEEHFVKRELAFQKRKLGQPGISAFQMREYLVRLLYCHMLGYDVSFGFIHAVKLAQQGNLVGKRAGYVLCGLFLSSEAELVILLINTLQRDLQSSNILDICTALTAACHIISPDTIPALLPAVQEKLRHDREIVRKKAVMCMHAFYRKSPETMEHCANLFHKALCDKEPGVMWAALHYFHDAVQVNPGGRSDLVVTLTGILDQIQNHRLPTDYEYHSCPAPWLQILILKTLSHMGHGNREQSKLMYDVLLNALKKTDPSHKIGLGVIYECVMTVLHIWPYPAILEQASTCVGRFLSANSNNLKCLGLQALSSMVEACPEYAMKQQNMVLQCLENNDITIRTRTLELLYNMANQENMRLICSKMIDHLAISDDENMRADMISKVLILTHRFADDRKWYIETVMKVLLLAGEKSVPPDIVKQVIQQIETDDGMTGEVQLAALKTCWDLLHRTTLPEPVLEIALWIIGHYGQLEFTEEWCELVLGWYSKLWISVELQCQIVEVFINMSHQYQLTSHMLQQLQQYAKHGNMHLQQSLRELKNLQRLCEDKSVENLMSTKVPVTEMDFSLSFLDEYVVRALERGQDPYKPPSMRLNCAGTSAGPGSMAGHTTNHRSSVT